MTGNRMIDMILLGISTVATLLALSLFVYIQFVYQRPLPDNEIEKEKLFDEARVSVYPEIIKLEKIVVNLPSKSSRLRFLEMTLNIIPFKAGKSENVESNKARINDAIIEIGSKMTPNELNSISGKLLLKIRLKKKLNAIFGEQLVKDLAFSTFVVQ